MRSPMEEDIPLTLVIQRLMDADLLLPEEGAALLAEIEAFDRARCEVPGERASENSEPLLPRLEALLQADRLDTSIAGQVQVIVRRILHGENDPA